MPLLNPLIVSMLVLPLLQIVSLPQNAIEHCDGQWTIRDCQMRAKQLLLVVRQCAIQHPYHPGRHDNISTGSLPVLPAAVSHTCGAYVHLARYLSVYLCADSDDNSVIGEWLQQVHGSLLADLRPSSLLTLLVTSIFLIRDDTPTVDKCLQLLLTVCQSDKTQVSLLMLLQRFS